MTGLPQTVGPSPVIGPGIFGLVTVGMYDNPLAIYREYIQNSADAIASMAVLEAGRIEITIDRSDSWIRLRDNGPGLSHDDCLQQLVSIGRSNKQLGRDRGFRGIGRLVGLAFAKTVTFTTRTPLDEFVTRVTWNSSGLPSSTTSEGEVERVIQDCVKVETLREPGYPDHFFEVEVCGIARHAAGFLLNRDAVRSYVSEVCPVPMSKAFPYSHRIPDLFKPNELPMSLDITLDGDREPVKRPHGRAFQLSANREDSVRDLEEIRIPGIDRVGDAAVGWIAHSAYLGAIPKESRIRGIRARVGNIQIGDETVFDGLFSEDRFNRWCVGEVHILDHRIVPNARRDYFEPGPHLRNLENHLIPTLRKIGGRCRAASTARNRTRKVISTLSHIEETHDLAVSGYLAVGAATHLVYPALQQLRLVRDAIPGLKLEKEYVERLDQVEKKLTNFNIEAIHRPFADMAPSDIGAYQKVFQVLAKVASSPSTAKELMAAILLRAAAADNSGAGDE